MSRSTREVAAGYDVAAAAYDQRHGDPLSLARARVLDAPLLGAARGADRVLEIGVGTGRLLAQVGAPLTIGVDVSSAMLARAHARHLTVAQADAQLLPFAEGAFDVVLAAKGVFRYLDHHRAFAEASRVLRTGGTLALQHFGARTWSPGHRRVPADGVHEVDRIDGLLALARGHGFSARDVRCYRLRRNPPYLREIPWRLDRWSPVQLWEHLVVVLRRD